MSSLKKFDYRIKDNRKRNIFLCGIVFVIIIIVGVKLYQSKAQFTGTSSELNLASGKVRLSCTDKVKPKYNQELTNYVNELYESGECPELVNDETEDNNIRYIGASPDNYVKFNDELWRIIGVMNNVDDGTSKKEARVKLIRAESLGQFSWDYKQIGVGSSIKIYGSNDWSDSQLMMMLNPKDVVLENWQNQESKKNYQIDEDGTATDGTHTIYKEVGSYFNRKSGYKPATAGTTGFTETTVDFSDSGLKDESKSLINKVIFNLGSLELTNLPIAKVSQYYEGERSKTVYNSNPITWIGYVGLMYASDYGFATSGGETANRNNCLDKELYYWNELEDCHKKNWLFGQQWLITSRSDLKSYVFTIDYNGARSSKLINETFKIKPVVYLKSNVLITSGNGSKENPFKIAL